jgi:hypothetical protein
MKVSHAIAMAALLAILGAGWWVASDDTADDAPVAVVSNARGPDSLPVGEAAVPSFHEARVVAAASSERTPAEDTGVAGNPTSTPDGNAGAPAARPQTFANPQDAQPLAKRTADPDSARPSALDKSACDASAKTLSDSLSIFDLTPTQAIWYAHNPTPPLHAAPSGFDVLKQRLLAPLCTGTEAFNADYAALHEFVAISTDRHVRIFVGDHWISDGTVLSQLSQPEQQFFADSIIQRRRAGPGPNSSREAFERNLALDPRRLLPQR